MFETATNEQSVAILGAASTVVDHVRQAQDDQPGLGEALLVAAGAMLFAPAVDVTHETVEPVDEQTLARVLAGDRALQHHAAAILACASLMDGRVDEDRLRLVVRYAQALHVSDGWVRDLLQVARGHLAWALADMARRNVSTFPGWARPDDQLPPLLAYREQDEADRRLAVRFAELEGLPRSTFGHQFWAHFRRHGFAFPGEPEAYDGHFAVPHDGLHVLSGYSTSIEGEMLVSTFTGAMHRRDALRAHLLPVLFQWHVGVDVRQIGAQRAALDPAAYLHAWERGDAMASDVLDPGWDFWRASAVDLDELREQYAIEPLAPAFAARGTEITVPGQADPFVR